MSIAAPRHTTTMRPASASVRPSTPGSALDGKAELLARLTLRLQSTFGLKPHAASARAKALLTLLPAPPKGTTLDLDAVIAKEAVLASTRRTTTAGGSSLQSPSARSGAKGEAAATAAATAALISPHLAELYLSRPSNAPGAILEALPPTTRRSRAKHDLWTELVVVQAEAVSIESYSAFAVVDDECTDVLTYKYVA